MFFLIDQVASSFELQELENLRSNFDKVILVTSDKNCNLAADERFSIELINPNGYKTSDYIGRSLRYLPQFIAEFFRNIKHLSHPKLYMINVSLFLRSIYLSECIHSIVKKHAKDQDKLLLYSFWFNHWANAITFLRKKLSGNNKFITRVHGTDLFEERVIGLKRIAFRKYYMKGLDAIFSVSENGTNYLKKRYPSQADKISTIYLGTNFFGKNEVRNEEIFTIVTCAHIRKIKRLHEFPKILSLVKNSVRWVHIGVEAKNDPYAKLFYEQVELLKKNNPSVEVVLKGDMTNEEVFTFYKTSSVNLFASVSENEGLPVSMMEAISAGIPILSTDVGGCREIVTPVTGILIDKYFEINKVAELIDKLIVEGIDRFSDRNEIHAYWKAHFENSANFDSFINKLKMGEPSYKQI